MAPPVENSARRQLILTAAEGLLRHYGFAKTTVADIAREAGVGVGTVYLEFASKEAIVAALAEARHQAVLDAMRRAATAAPASFAERLEGLLTERLTHFLQFAGEGQHGDDLVSCGCSAVQGVHASFRDEEWALLSQFLDDARRAGEFDCPEPGQTARLLIGFLDSLQPGCPDGPDEEIRSAYLASAFDLVLRGLLHRN